MPNNEIASQRIEPEKNICIPVPIRQGLAAGALNYEELRSLCETEIGFVDAIRADLGFPSVTELLFWARKNKIPAETLKRALATSGLVVRAERDRARAVAWTNLKNAILSALGLSSFQTHRHD
tara:strand:- start:186 stop:554 length:369 start_codon:yes stop_codon:yes gene_type:complete